MSGCRFCGTKLDTTFCDLGQSPLSNSYLNADQLTKNEPFYPLHVYVCRTCLLVQLMEYESPDAIFSDYAYFSSYSDAWLKHSKEYVDMITKRLKLGANSQVIEIASNDGYLLQYFKEKGIPVLGVEPAANVAKTAEAKGIPSLVAFFGVKTAKALVDKGVQADLLLGNNVLAHVPDINDFVGGQKVILKPGGVITMEFPHLLQLMTLNQFDTIYHEHFSYLSFQVVEKIFAKHGLTLFDVDELPTHGGSLRIYARHQENSELPVTDAVKRMKRKESDAGLDRLDAYLSFQPKVTAVKQKVVAFFQEAKRSGKSVVGYGAPAKGNTLLNFCGIKADLMSYTVDRSPHKQNRYLPGTHIPIFSPEKITESRPDYVFILPWNLKDEIVSQMAHVRDWGGRFVVPIPSVQVL